MIYKAEVVITNECFINAETVEEAQARFHENKTYGPCRLEESDKEAPTAIVSIKEVTKACGCTEDKVCDHCIPF